MIRYLIPIIFLLTILFSSLFFDYWNFVFKLTVNNLSELLIFVENKFLLSLMFFTILYLVSTALSLPIGTFLTFLGGYIFGVFIGFFLVVIGATLGAVILFLIIKIGFIKSVESIKNRIYKNINIKSIESIKYKKCVKSVKSVLKSVDTIIDSMDSMGSIPLTTRDTAL